MRRAASLRVLLHPGGGRFRSRRSPPQRLAVAVTLSWAAKIARGGATDPPFGAEGLHAFAFRAGMRRATPLAGDNALGKIWPPGLFLGGSTRRANPDR
jgi:hypothetical protein